MGKRQEAAQETKRKITEAVKLLLNEKKTDEISIEEITARAGVAKGSFYTYFKRKEDAICCAAFDEYNAVKNDTINSRDGVYANLCAYLKRSAKIIDAYTLQAAQGWMKSVTAPLDGENQGVRKYDFDKEIIQTLMENAVQRGELVRETPVQKLTMIVMNSYYGAVAVWCLTDGSVSLTDSMECFCKYGMKAILCQYCTGGDH